MILWLFLLCGFGEVYMYTLLFVTAAPWWFIENNYSESPPVVLLNSITASTLSINASSVWGGACTVSGGLHPTLIK